MVFRPNKKTFEDMIEKVSDPHYHKPNDADQAFLQVYWKYRFYTLPFKFNFNLIMVRSSHIPRCNHQLRRTIH